MDLTTVILFVVGLVLLVAGAELLVRGAAKLATRLGISALVVGLTVVAFGTSSPELAVSFQAGLAGQADIALGNVVGSNIFNILFILGVSALIVPLVVSHQIVRLEVPIMIAVSMLLLVVTYDGRITIFDGGILFAGIVAYTAFAIRNSSADTAETQQQYENEFGARPDQQPGTLDRLTIQLALIVGGLALLVVGSNWLVEGAVAFAQLLGVSELVIGLTIVAAGTSLPEVATSVVAAIRKERDIAVGNVIGSCIFNILCILGLSSVVTPNGLSVSPQILAFDIPLMVAVSIACLPLFAFSHQITRANGALFLAAYVSYVAYQILVATDHAVLPTFIQVMQGIVLPITVAILITIMVAGKKNAVGGGNGSTD